MWLKKITHDLKKIWDNHKSAIILIVAVLGIITLPTFLYTRYLSIQNKRISKTTVEKVTTAQISKIPSIISASPVNAGLAPADCTAQTIACDEQFKANKTLACGAFKAQAVDELLNRSDSPCQGLDRTYVSQQLDEACQKGCVATPEQPTATPTPSPSPTITPSPTPTVTPTPTPTVTPTPIPPTSTPTPSPTPTTVPTATQSSLQLGFEITMPGVGTAQFENNAPLHPTRNTSVSIYDNTTDGKVTDTQIQLVFNSANSSYTGTLSYSAESTKQYYVKISIPGTLIKKIPGVYSPKSSLQQTPKTRLIPGDIQVNNEMEVQDYNLMVACYKSLPTCTQSVKDLADLNDDGTINVDDLNILQRSYATGKGDLSSNSN